MASIDAAAPPRVEVVLGALAAVAAPVACVLLAVAVFCEADVVWLVVALGLIVTLLCGIARKVASVFTDVLAVGDTACLEVVLVVLPALLVVLPLVPLVVPVACVLLAVEVFCVAEVVWLVVPLGLMVTLLCGIARNVVFVSTDVLALGATDCVAEELVLLVAVLPVWASTEPPVRARTTEAMAVSLLLIMGTPWIGCVQG